MFFLHNVLVCNQNINFFKQQQQNNNGINFYIQEDNYKTKLVKLEDNNIILIDRPENYYKYQSQIKKFEQSLQQAKKEIDILNDVIKEIKQSNQLLQKLLQEKDQKICNLEIDLEFQRNKTIKKTDFTQKKEFKTDYLDIKNEIFRKYEIIYQDLDQFKKNYEIGAGIGKGGYGNINDLKILKKDLSEEEKQSKYVVKSLDILQVEQEYQEREILALQQVDLLPDHLRKYIIKLKEVYLDEENAQILMIIPKAETSFARQILFNKRSKTHYLPKDLTYKLSCSLLGLQTLDLLGILHRDMKPDNMLVMQDGSIVLADYGTSKQFNTMNTVLTGTPSYHSPELLQNFGKEKDENEYFSQISIKIFKDCDLYAIGQTFVFAASLIPPPQFNHKINNYEEHIEIKEKWYEQAFAQIESDQKYSPQFVELLKGMVQKDPKKRFSFKECLDRVGKLPDW